jgi:hypothetical protein
VNIERASRRYSFNHLAVCSVISGIFALLPAGACVAQTATASQGKSEEQEYKNFDEWLGAAVTGVKNREDFHSNLPQHAIYALPGNIVVGYYHIPLNADNIKMEHLHCDPDKTAVSSP